LYNYEPTYGQFFADSEENESNTNVTGTSNVTSTDSESDSPQIVLLSQKLKNAFFGYRDLIGQVKNVGNDTAESIQIHLSVYDKSGGIIGSEYTYADVNSLKPGQKSAFTIMSDSDNFKGMDYYELALEWSNPDSSQDYVENVQIYEQK
jgi:hypothetical protein